MNVQAITRNMRSMADRAARRAKIAAMMVHAYLLDRHGEPESTPSVDDPKLQQLADELTDRGKAVVKLYRAQLKRALRL